LVFVALVSATSHRALFTEWKQQHNKVYTDSEHVYRLSVFFPKTPNLLKLMMLLLVASLLL